ncbi:hypothetical protein E1B28_011140 [Marasmius oreades]|uniref:Telomerase reverse transcriptase n=1 Tax=Marasmius oreades TaxID=181124 RepID=A0A9P7RU69_9AGAR|nr:uncharacterized protein E1B28_011140 [Marasmius oreades]KAG7089455.1 hypothetical protein E1B28_011140 [Marasmius oreades]
MANKSPTVSLLESYYKYVIKLQDYLATLNDQVPLVKEDDNSAYQNLIATSYVACDHDLPLDSNDFLGPVDEYLTIGEVIRISQGRLLTGKKWNLLTLGYKLLNGAVTNDFANTLVTALHAPEWCTLLQRIGGQAMGHLLTKASIFISLPNGCLCQMTGKPLYSLLKPRSVAPRDSNFNTVTRTIQKRKALGPPSGERPTKRLKIYPRKNTKASKAGVGTTTRSPVQVLLIRQRVLYSRPMFSKGTHQIMIGLSPIHILNRLENPFPGQTSSQKYKDPDSKIQERNVRHLAKYVFPRQYGMPSSFEFFKFSEREAYKVPDFVDRDGDIKKLASAKREENATIKTPKRVKQILPLLDKLIWRHGKCKYKKLLDGSCPSKMKNREINGTIILEMISENRVLSQLHGADSSLDTAGNSILPIGLTQAEREAKRKPQFAEFCCPHGELVIPKAFWGNKDNFKQICRHIKTFITARRYDKVSLHHVLQGLSTTACDWLLPPGDGQKQLRVPATDALKRRELMEDFIFWLFDSFIISLIRTTFYVTESSAFRNRLLYFRHDDWNVLCAPLLKDLSAQKFKKIEDEEAYAILNQRKLGFSFVRLLPKELGVRPIVNLRRKQASSTLGSNLSINALLQAALQILTYEKENQPHLVGAACFSTDNHYSKLKEYKLRLSRNSDGCLPRLYFAKVDVQACFDTIDQTKLLEILRGIISEDTYSMQKYAQVSPVMEKPRTLFRKRAWPEGDQPHFLKYATDLANALRHTIFVDQVTCPLERKNELLDLLEQHIKENIVKFGNCYYRQMIGIPQGSTLSTILCSFFYGDMERQFGRFTEDPQSALLRNVDDYLYVTTRLEKARKFVDMMSKGHPEYGCFISKGKTLTNFDYDEELMNVTGPMDKCFPWCGYLIAMKDLSVYNDYSRYHGGHLRDSLTVNRAWKSGSEFRRKMLLLAKTRSHVIYTDPQLNSENAVFMNVYQNFLIAALKMHCFLRHWDAKAKKNKDFIHETVKQMFSYCFVSIRNKTLNKVARDNLASISIQKADVVWLGTHAFHTILSRKAAHYHRLLRSLSFELALPKNKRRARRFKGLVREGFAAFPSIIE